MSVYIGSPRREVQNCAGGRQLQADKKVNELFLAPCHLYIIERAKLWMYIINCTNLITMDHDANLPTSNSRQLEIRLRVEPRLMGNFCLSSPPNHHRLQRSLGLRGSWTYVESWRWRLTMSKFIKILYLVAPKWWIRKFPITCSSAHRWKVLRIGSPRWTNKWTQPRIFVMPIVISCPPSYKD